ncbi:UNKNOWN [Stylonychia lemnae]|uniref:Uncharacterized protein n=1 Tax=Stylonychia lemnae TaxID=5949 RepID=A0A078B479_STYLE|nr:UNKNOWN [Stylonychia lemnae]|eukprot:CDW89056.1 UNKNOWN [Stylonychia lemnae]
MIRFTRNSYKQNFASNNDSLISIQAPRSFFDNENFIGNGESSFESTVMLGQDNLYVMMVSNHDSEPYAVEISTLGLYPYRSSLIELFRHGEIKLINSTFDSNWQYETVASNIKGQILTLAFFQGQLTIDGLTIQNHIGIKGNPYGPEALGFTVTQNQRLGAISPFFKLQWDTRILIKYVNNFKTFSKFKNIKWQKDDALSNIPMLINYRDSKLYLPIDQYSHIQDFQMKNALFEDIDCFNCNYPILLISSNKMEMMNVTFRNINIRTDQIYSTNVNKETLVQFGWMFKII